ncbi:MAG: hypothetical protein AAFV86_14815, partial [Pseudomonadota bacterium]
QAGRVDGEPERAERRRLPHPGLQRAHAVHPSSLQLLQPAVERHLDPVLWDPYILAALEAPAFVSALVLAVLFAGLALAFRPRRRRTLMD